MKAMHVTAILLAAALAAVGHWLWVHVPDIYVSISIADGGEAGWAGLTILWPILVAVGLTIGLGLAVLLALVLSVAASKDDAKAEARIRAAEASAAEAIAAERERANRTIAEESAEALREQSAAIAMQQHLSVEIKKADERVRRAESWAHSEVEKAKAETAQQSKRALNAICAAERIKRRIEGKSRIEVKKSH